MFSPEVAPVDVNPVPAVTLFTKSPVVSVAKATLLAWIVATPASVIAISPETEAKIASSKFSKVIFPEPLSVASTIAIKSSSAIVVSVVNSFKSTAKLLDAVISPPPLKPFPAVKVTEL